MTAHIYEASGIIFSIFILVFMNIPEKSVVAALLGADTNWKWRQDHELCNACVNIIAVSCIGQFVE